jgi:hypothetical protein
MTSDKEQQHFLEMGMKRGISDAGTACAPQKFGTKSNWP